MPGRCVQVYDAQFYVPSGYALRKALGRGAYGIVCSARNTHTGDKVAIKRIHPMASDDYDARHTLREVRLMRYLGRHKNIITMKNLLVRERQDEMYITMELMDTDLHKLIQSPQALSVQHNKHFMFQLLMGLKFLHDNGVLHRDLKPANLLISRNCELRIADFGLARMAPEPKKGDPCMTEHVVTRWYRCPELMLNGDGIYDAAVDVWSCGCILAELLGRTPLFPGKNFLHQLELIFDVTGTPSSEDVGKIKNEQALRFLYSLQPKRPVPWTTLFPDADPLALDLIDKMLVFNPQERITVAEALKHPYLADMYAKSEEKNKGKMEEIATRNISFDFEHDKSVTVPQLRQMLVDEAVSFRKERERTKEKARAERKAAKLRQAEERIKQKQKALSEHSQYSSSLSSRGSESYAERAGLNSHASHSSVLSRNAGRRRIGTSSSLSRTKSHSSKIHHRSRSKSRSRKISTKEKEKEKNRKEIKSQDTISSSFSSTRTGSEGVSNKQGFLETKRLQKQQAKANRALQKAEKAVEAARLNAVALASKLARDAAQEKEKEQERKRKKEKEKEQAEADAKADAIAKAILADAKVKAEAKEAAAEKERENEAKERKREREAALARGRAKRKAAEEEEKEQELIAERKKEREKSSPALPPPPPPTEAAVLTPPLHPNSASCKNDESASKPINGNNVSPAERAAKAAMMRQAMSSPHTQPYGSISPPKGFSMRTVQHMSVMSSMEKDKSTKEKMTKTKTLSQETEKITDSEKDDTSPDLHRCLDNALADAMVSVSILTTATDDDIENDHVLSDSGENKSEGVKTPTSTVDGAASMRRLSQAWRGSSEKKEKKLNTSKADCNSDESADTMSNRVGVSANLWAKQAAERLSPTIDKMESAQHAHLNSNTSATQEEEGGGEEEKVFEEKEKKKTKTKAKTKTTTSTAKTTTIQTRGQKIAKEALMRALLGPMHRKNGSMGIDKPIPRPVKYSDRKSSRSGQSARSRALLGGMHTTDTTTSSSTGTSTTSATGTKVKPFKFTELKRQRRQKERQRLQRYSGVAAGHHHLSNSNNENVESNNNGNSQEFSDSYGARAYKLKQHSSNAAIVKSTGALGQRKTRQLTVPRSPQFSKSRAERRKTRELRKKRQLHKSQSQ